MVHFLGFAVPGIPNGCTFALFAIGLILTYQATGVFNFAFAAQAYTSAFVYGLLCLHGWPVWFAFLVSVVILAPALGLGFDYFLFRRIPNTNSTAKVVTGISLLVGIPSLLTVIFGNQQLDAPPSLLFNADTVYFHLFGVTDLPINGIDIGTVIVTVVVLVAMVVLLRYTSMGLKMRGSVESRRLIQLDGVNADRVVAFSWAVSSFLAGLAGVLFAHQLAPVQPENYQLLLITAIAAAAWGRLRSMPVAALVAIVLGVIESVAPAYLPTGGFLNAVVVPVIPMIVLALALLFVPGLRSLDDSKDPLASIDPPTPPTAAASRAPTMDRIIRTGWYALLVVFVVSMLTWMPVLWEGVFNEGLAFSVIFLSITLITGMGGQLSLAQATLAGVGAFTTGLLFYHFGFNELSGGIVGAVLASVVAVALALLSLRLRGLGLALMTLAAAVFFDQGVFNQPQVQPQSGALSLIPLSNPKWPGPVGIFERNGHWLFVVCMVVLVLVTLAVLQIRKGTTGHYLGAMRGSETGAAGLGINLSWQRIMIFALSGAVAGIGGTLFAYYQTSVTPNYFNVDFSLVFVVVVVTTGVSTVEGAIQAGIGLTVTFQLVTYLPGRLGGQSLVFVLFAFGALTYAAHPEGVLEFQKRRSTLRFERLLFSGSGRGASPGDQGPQAAAAVAPEGGGRGD